MIRVVVVDDDPLVTESLRTILDLSQEIRSKYGEFCR